MKTKPQTQSPMPQAEVKEKPYHKCLDTFANQLRLKILNSLKDGPKTVTELTEKTGAERTNVSHNLAVLKKCSVIESTRKGKKQIYAIKDVTILREVGSAPVLTAFDEHIENHCRYCHKLNRNLKTAKK